MNISLLLRHRLQQSYFFLFKTTFLLYSDPAFHAAPSFLQNPLLDLNFLRLVSAKGELFWNVLLKSSQLILTFGRRG